jgi:glycosyltransferase involved in cell wall biosynthesis
MRLLLIAPQPFYQERGTPIAVKLLIETLCDSGYRVDLLTYHEGEDALIKGLKVFRIKPPAYVSHVPIGISWKKIVCDCYILLKMIHLLSKRNYAVVHAIEEAVFPALLLKRVFRYKLVYDMDSSMVDQIVDKYPLIRALSKPMQLFEKLVVQGADLVLPVCERLSMKIAAYAPQKMQCILHDVPLVCDKDESDNVENIRENLGIKGTVALYAGNLERYQGIDLLIEAYATLPIRENIHLVVIGGDEAKVRQYKISAAEKGTDDRIHFIGSRPLDHLFDYLTQADILVSPRLSGQNTPMKIYSYLASGKPILATDIPSHNQVLDSSCSVLVKPEPRAIAEGLLELAGNKNLRRHIGFAGKEVVEKRYSRPAYKEKLLSAYATFIS